MISRLEELTAAKFVDLVCGDASVLLGSGEIVKPSVLAITARNIQLEYQEIADPSGSRAYVSDNEDKVKGKMAAMLFTICDNLLLFDQYDRVREVFDELGVRGASRMSDSRVKAEVASRLERAKRAMNEAGESEDKEMTPQEIRRGFESQTAALMAWFRFQIDTSTMKASLYAHLVARYLSEVKTQISTIKNRN